MSRWIDQMPANQRAELYDAGRLGASRFDGPEPVEPQALLLSVAEAARVMGGIDPDTVYTMCNQGTIPHVKLGRRTLVSYEGLRQWIAVNDGRDIIAGV